MVFADITPDVLIIDINGWEVGPVSAMQAPELSPALYFNDDCTLCTSNDLIRTITILREGEKRKITYTI